jgi:hypothetical protein
MDKIGRRWAYYGPGVGIKAAAAAAAHPGT